ncbi:MAG: TIGR03960 family B12-binding radical SAM protein [Lachnospiraceae bacterium]|nr:TIGR03960 family B12-binding radical SAM protein [Lachnospiraceae bacterium]
MNKLALSDDILMRVEKSARYIGNEINMAKKDPASVDLRYAFCFPDVYEIGMSHLGIQILYEMFNRRNDVYCERVYSPWPDLHAIMKEQHIPLFSLETQSPVRDFDFLGMTLQYEMCYTNILQILDLSDIPFYSKDRDETHPIFIGGGPCTYNPEPIADFFDIIYIGEGETRFDELFDLYIGMKKSGSYDRITFLHEAAQIEGLYVPMFYEVSYNPDHTIADFHPIYDDIPKTIVRQIKMDLDDSPYPENPIIPYLQVTQDRVVLEIMRGCIRGCRFCQAGMIYRPTRGRSLETLKKYAIEMLKSTGQDEISLSSLSSSDYLYLNDLLLFLIDECNKRKVNISLPSLRIDSFSLDVMDKVSDVKKSSLTFAPEGGSQRMRDIINKGLTKEDILGGAKEAFLGGWNKVKLYFMLGLPFETEEDMEAIPDLAEDIAMLYYDTVPKESRNGRCRITISTSFFVPKPFTPFQWATMQPAAEYKRRAHIVKDRMRSELNQKSISYQYHEPDVTLLEGIFARGDRRISRVIERAYNKGCFFDAWTEFFHKDLWDEAFREEGIDPDFYTMRERDIKEILPWDFIDVGIKRSFLEKEWENAAKGIVTPNCREKCSGCGIAKKGGGVCFENKN